MGSSKRRPMLALRASYPSVWIRESLFGCAHLSRRRRDDVPVQMPSGVAEQRQRDQKAEEIGQRRDRPCRRWMSSSRGALPLVVLHGVLRREGLGPAPAKSLGGAGWGLLPRIPLAVVSAVATSHPVSAAFTRPLALPKSIWPEYFAFKAAITLPMSFMPAAPVSAIATAIAAVTSCSDICFGR